MPIVPNCPEHNVWSGMHLRCKNPKSNSYQFYGGRGIVVCERWNDFFAFVEDMGRRPDGMSLDRIDPEGNYEPSNCRWATNREQSRNKRESVLYEWKGEQRTRKEISDMTDVAYVTLCCRLDEGMTIDEAIKTPKRFGNSSNIGKQNKSINTIAAENDLDRNALARAFKKHDGNIKQAIKTVKKNQYDQALEIIKVGKKEMTIDKWAERLGTSTRIIRQRLRRGMDPEQAVTQKPRSN